MKVIAVTIVIRPDATTTTRADVITTTKEAETKSTAVETNREMDRTNKGPFEGAGALGGDQLLQEIETLNTIIQETITQEEDLIDIVSPEVVYQKHSVLPNTVNIGNMSVMNMNMTNVCSNVSHVKDLAINQHVCSVMRPIAIDSWPPLGPLGNERRGAVLAGRRRSGPGHGVEQCRRRRPVLPGANRSLFAGFCRRLVPAAAKHQLPIVRPARIAPVRCRPGLFADGGGAGRGVDGRQPGRRFVHCRA